MNTRQYTFGIRSSRKSDILIALEAACKRSDWEVAERLLNALRTPPADQDHCATIIDWRGKRHDGSNMTH
jgi:hypothetical protein